MSNRDQRVRRLLDVAGRTYAAQARIKLSDKPMPLFQLLVLCMLASKPIDAAIAVGAAAELFKAGLRTPKAALDADRQTMIDAFGRAHYVRYDESSATRLTDMAERVRDDYSGDLRELAARSEHDTASAKRMLKKFKGIGDTGADIFLREVKTCGPGCGPTSMTGPPAPPETGAARRAGQTGKPCAASNARLAAALVRASLDDDVRRQVSG